MNKAICQYFLSVNSPLEYPVDYYYVDIIDKDSNTIAFSCDNTFYGEWGTAPEEITYDEGFSLPNGLSAQWLSAIEKKYYFVEIMFSPLDNEAINNIIALGGEINIVVGLSPFGGLSLWIRNEKKSKIIKWIYGSEIGDEVAQIFPNLEYESIDMYYEKKLANNSYFIQNLETNGLPPRDLFDNYMKQFTYRYLPLFERWDENEEKWTKYTEEEQETKPELDFIEEALYDGTHDKLHDGGLLNYHKAGKPKKLAVKWHIKKSEYSAYFWFEDKAIRAVFDRFYEMYPDTKTDFIIHIDSIKNKYQLSLSHDGLDEPVILPEEAYQLIVFKNKFEHFRSDNYDQPRGAWIW